MADTESTTGYPKMWYHPVTGSFVICQAPSEVPEGFVESLSEVSNPQIDGMHGPAPCTDFTVPDDAEKPAAKKAPAKKAAPKKAAAKKAPEPTGPTLEALKMSREEAVDMLEEEEVEFDAEADDNALAALVQELLDEE